MTVSESDFETATERCLQRLCRAIEEASDDIDVELQGGVLTAELEDGRTFVLNRHMPLRQLWLSSPLSGASHFAHTDGSWRSTRGGSDLDATLVDDFGCAGIVLDLES